MKSDSTVSESARLVHALTFVNRDGRSCLLTNYDYELAAAVGIAVASAAFVADEEIVVVEPFLQ